MLSPWTIYWIMRLDTIIDVAQTIGIIAGVIGSFTLFAYVTVPDGDDVGAAIKRTCGKMSAVCLPLVAITTLLYTFTPKTSDMAVIYVVPKVVNSQLVQETIPKEAAEMYGLLKSRLSGDSNNALHAMAEALADVVTNHNNCVSQQWQKNEEVSNAPHE